MSNQKIAVRRLQPVGELLTLRYVPLAQVALWERNPKRHDLPGIMAAIKRYGFQKPPKYDQALNNGAGGIAAGNGRVQALLALQARGDPAPAGIAVDKQSGVWAAPVIFGNDLADQSAAEAFAIDHNNLVLAGGDFTSIYMTQMWDEEQYVTLLREMGAERLPETVDLLDLEIFNEVLFGDETPRQREDKGAKIRLGMYRFYISREIYEAWEDGLRVAVGEGREVIIAELKRRLGVGPHLEGGEAV
jgi:hypothetical protein